MHRDVYREGAVAANVDHIVVRYFAEGHSLDSATGGSIVVIALELHAETGEWCSDCVYDLADCDFIQVWYEDSPMGGSALVDRRVDEKEDRSSHDFQAIGEHCMWRERLDSVCSACS